jgi:hypothetical protein
MSLVKKLPVGLGMACIMMLSSCSKEDVQTPQPQAGSVNESSGLKVGPGSTTAPDVIIVPVFPGTAGQAGQDIFPAVWKYSYGTHPNTATYPSGTSTLSHLWGNPSMPWKKALLPVPSAQSGGSIVTITTADADWGVAHDGSIAETRITNLVEGKDYAITFYVATTVRDIPMVAPFVPAYAKTVSLRLGDNTTHLFSLGGKEAEWVKKTVTFKAKGTETAFSVMAKSGKDKEYSYVHILVDKNAIKKLN